MEPEPYLIVVAEDNGADVFLVKEALSLRKLQYEMKAIDDGEEMLRYVDSLDGDAQQRCPRLFLLDLNLPKASGDEILQHLRKSNRCGNVPVIVTTSSDSPRDRVRAQEMGAVAYFRKPSDLEAFMEIGKLIEEVLTRS